ncbi:DNA primase [Candidatus Roizmanbacteria bacterium]|nr:DNA primase [Candidatus Roizmanbacteria bacterium]
MDNPVEAIKQKLDIVDFVGSFTTLKKTGRNFKANCPFHQEKTPSFVVSPERQIWHCFGACQEGGDVIKFLMKWENVTFFEALKELAEKTGVTLKKVGFEDTVWKKKEHLIVMNNLSAEFYEYILHQTKFGKKALEYLQSRDIKSQIAKKFQLGYAPNSWNSLTQFLKKKKYSEEEINETGLLVRSDRGGYYDRFRGRLIFPIKDPRGNIIGFSGRNIDAKDTSAKYINTPETILYHKRETLFGLDVAKESIKKEKNVVIVEGEFDMIAPYQNGFSHFVAIKGSALTREQLMLLKRYTDKITLALDADAAGEEAIQRGIQDAEQLDFEVGVVMFDYAKDPDEAVRKDEKLFKKILGKPMPVYDFLIQMFQKKYPDDNPFNKKKIGDEIIPFIERIHNPIVQSHYLKKLAEFLNVSESFQNENPYHVAKKLFAVISSDDFSIGSYKKICSMFIELMKSYPDQFNLSKFTETLSSELQPVFDEIYLFASSELGFENEHIDKLAYGIKRFSLKRQIQLLLSSELPQKEELKKLTDTLKDVEKKALSL